MVMSTKNIMECNVLSTHDHWQNNKKGLLQQMFFSAKVG